MEFGKGEWISRRANSRRLDSALGEMGMIRQEFGN